MSCGFELTAERDPTAAVGDPGGAPERLLADDLDDESTEDDALEGDPTDPGAGADLPPLVARDAPADELVACSVCGARNSARRILCGACGADLETGEIRATRRQARMQASPPIDDEDEDTTEEELRPRPRRRMLLPSVIALGVLVGTGIGTAVALQWGPFAPEVPEEPPFDAIAYPGSPTTLPPADIETTTTHPPLADRTFASEKMIDGDPTTAWNSYGEQRPDGIGESLRIRFADPVWITEMIVANGEQRDDARFLGNARLRLVELRFPGGDRYEVTLLDRRGEQVVRLDRPRLTTEVVLDVLEVYPGDTYEDLAVTEIAFRGHVAHGSDVRIARQRAEATVRGARSST